MNIYVLVEGVRTEKLVYASWIPFINPALTLALRLEDVGHNNYYIEGGGGFPFLYEIIEGAVENVATTKVHGHNLFDRLVIAADSENMTRAERYAEIQERVDAQCALNHWTIDTRIVIQHFCFETWALGNRRLIRGNISNPRLATYIHDYNVSTRDPELLPERADEELNRAQHAKKYLKLLFNEKYPMQTFSAVNPGPLTHVHYFDQIKLRREQTAHVDSFGAVLSAFQ